MHIDCLAQEYYTFQSADNHQLIVSQEIFTRFCAHSKVLKNFSSDLAEMRAQCFVIPFAVNCDVLEQWMRVHMCCNKDEKENFLRSFTTHQLYTLAIMADYIGDSALLQDHVISKLGEVLVNPLKMHDIYNYAIKPWDFLPTKFQELLVEKINYHLTKSTCIKIQRPTIFDAEKKIVFGIDDSYIVLLSMHTLQVFIHKEKVIEKCIVTFKENIKSLACSPINNHFFIATDKNIKELYARNKKEFLLKHFSDIVCDDMVIDRYGNFYLANKPYIIKTTSDGGIIKKGYNILFNPKIALSNDQALLLAVGMYDVLTITLWDAKYLQHIKTCDISVADIRSCTNIMVQEDVLHIICGTKRIMFDIKAQQAIAADTIDNYKYYVWLNDEVQVQWNNAGEEMCFWTKERKHFEYVRIFGFIYNICVSPSKKYLVVWLCKVPWSSEIHIWDIPSLLLAFKKHKTLPKLCEQINKLDQEPVKSSWFKRHAKHVVAGAAIAIAGYHYLKSIWNV